MHIKNEILVYEFYKIWIKQTEVRVCKPNKVVIVQVKKEQNF